MAQELATWPNPCAAHLAHICFKVTVPPALEASSRPQRDFDFEYERKVMQQEGSGLVDRFLGKAEVGAGGGAARVGVRLALSTFGLGRKCRCSLWLEGCLIAESAIGL
jgi:hypothetical protein